MVRGERERERERERETDRQTDRQTETERETEAKTDGEIQPDRKTYDTAAQPDRDKQTYR